MPTYDYKCDACSHEFSKEQRITEKPLKTCPKCKKKKARRMISGTGNFLLKGGGWESDLYSGPSNRSGSSPPPKSAESPSSKSDKKDSAKSVSSSDTGSTKSSGSKSSSSKSSSSKSSSKSSSD